VFGEPLGPTPFEKETKGKSALRENIKKILRITVFRVMSNNRVLY